MGWWKGAQKSLRGAIVINERRNLGRKIPPGIWRGGVWLFLAASHYSQSSRQWQQQPELELELGIFEDGVEWMKSGQKRIFWRWPRARTHLAGSNCALLLINEIYKLSEFV